jgi:hypothetical protein
MIGQYYLQFSDGKIGRSHPLGLDAAIDMAARYATDEARGRREGIRRAWVVSMDGNQLRHVYGRPPANWTPETPPDTDGAT